MDHETSVEAIVAGFGEVLSQDVEEFI